MKMSKNTDELDFELKNAYDIHGYVVENRDEFSEKRLIEMLGALVARSGKTKATISHDAWISEPYLYDILSGKKQPSRNSVIKLAFGLALDVATTERLLMLAGYRGFYVRQKRDALLKHALQNRMPAAEADALLIQYGFALIDA
jgi:DNA-binding phage protein